jgi:hypothetical protein
LDRTVEMLVPLPNDRVERLGTKTEGFVGRGPAVLDHTPASVVTRYVENTPQRIGCDVISPLKCPSFQSGVFWAGEKR